MKQDDTAFPLVGDGHHSGLTKLELLAGLALAGILARPVGPENLERYSMRYAALAARMARALSEELP